MATKAAGERERERVRERERESRAGQKNEEN